MDQKIKNLLDKTYELEGLLMLALKRDDDRSHLLGLIARKSAEIASQANNFDSSSALSSQDRKEPFVLEEYLIDDESDPSLQINKEESDISERSDNEPETPDPIITEMPLRGKLVFTVNDRFRFKRELFQNSDAGFNNSLALVASMENFDEAEEYFLSDLGFNPANPVVADFFAVIKRYFS